MREGERQRVLDAFVKAMADASGTNLLSIVLYGSAVGPEFSPRYSDLNLLVLLRNAGPQETMTAASVLRWWSEQGQPSPLVFTPEELQRAADVFAIELLDIQQQHRILYGEDLVSSMAVPLDFHRVQIERELRLSIVRLRQRYAHLARRPSLALEMMVESASTFHTLLRHALIAMGERPPVDRREDVDRVQQVFGVDATALRTLLALREGTLSSRKVDAGETFAGYLQALMALAGRIDRELPRRMEGAR